MSKRNSLWILEEPPPTDDEVLADLLSVPEIKRYVVRDRHDDELGLRKLLERPETLSRSLAQRKHPRTRKRVPDLQHAA